MRLTAKSRASDMPPKVNKNVSVYADYEKQKQHRRNLSVACTTDFNFSPRKNVHPLSTRHMIGDIDAMVPVGKQKKNIHDTFRERAHSKIELC